MVHAGGLRLRFVRLSRAPKFCVTQSGTEAIFCLIILRTVRRSRLQKRLGPFVQHGPALPIMFSIVPMAQHIRQVTVTVTQRIRMKWPTGASF